MGAGGLFAFINSASFTGVLSASAEGSSTRGLTGRHNGVNKKAPPRNIITMSQLSAGISVDFGHAAMLAVGSWESGVGFWLSGSSLPTRGFLRVAEIAAKL